MKKQLSAVGLFITSYIAYEKILVEIRDSQFFMQHIALAILAIMITSLVYGLLCTFGIETIWPEFLTGNKKETEEFSST